MKGLRTALSLGLDSHDWKCATDLGDKPLLQKLAMGDMVVLKARYHASCLLKLYNKCRPANSGCSSENSKDKSQAFAELVCYMEHAS